jgi:predicted transcriptional regulator
MTELTIPLDSATDAALDQIASASKRSKVDVAADLLAGLARDEADTVAAILRASPMLMRGERFPMKKPWRGFVRQCAGSEAAFGSVVAGRG